MSRKKINFVVGPRTTYRHMERLILTTIDELPVVATPLCAVLDAAAGNNGEATIDGFGVRLNEKKMNGLYRVFYLIDDDVWDAMIEKNPDEAWCALSARSAVSACEKEAA